MILELKHIYKNYMQGKIEVPVLKDVSLQVEKGDFLSIMGPSGSGKSTLMNIIGCLDLPTSGQYILNGEDVLTKNDKELAKLRNECIGFVFQTFNLLPRQSALENVELPLIYAGVKSARRREIAAEMLKKVGLEERMNFRPNQLSGGQQQRVAIARALATDPEIIYFDEPTSALDPELTGEVLKVIRGLAQQHTTMIIVTHEMAFARDVADQVIFMDGGVIVEQGPAREVIDNPKQERTRHFLARYAEQ